MAVEALASVEGLASRVPDGWDNPSGSTVVPMTVSVDVVRRPDDFVTNLLIRGLSTSADSQYGPVSQQSEVSPAEPSISTLQPRGADRLRTGLHIARKAALPVLGAALLYESLAANTGCGKTEVKNTTGQAVKDEGRGIAKGAVAAGKGIVKEGAPEVGAIISNVSCFVGEGLFDALAGIRDAIQVGHGYHGTPGGIKDCVGYVDEGPNYSGDQKIKFSGAAGVKLADGNFFASYQTGNEVDFGSGPTGVSFDNENTAQRLWEGDGVEFNLNAKGGAKVLNAAKQLIVVNFRANPATMTVTG